MGVWRLAHSRNRMKAMRVLICLSGAIFIVASGSLADAAPKKIPASELAGRERERFVDPPIARFFQPGMPAAPLLTIQPDCRKGARNSKQRRSKRRKGC
jgi:hypothetical protein